MTRSFHARLLLALIGFSVILIVGYAGACTDNADCTDASACTTDICDSGICRNFNCDVDGNGNVGLSDVMRVVSHWATNEGDPGWDPVVDVDENGNIGLSDIMMIVRVWAANCGGGGDSTFEMFYGGDEHEYAKSLQKINGGYMIAGSTRSYSGPFEPDLAIRSWLFTTDENGDTCDYDAGNGVCDGDGVFSRIFNVSPRQARRVFDGYALIGTKSISGRNEMVFIKTDENGNTCAYADRQDCTEPGKFVQWFGFPDKEDAGQSFQQTQDGGYILLGRSISGSSYIWLIKTNENGETCDYTSTGECGSTTDMFVRKFGSSISISAHSVIQTSDGGYLIEGWGVFGTNRGWAWLIKTDEYGNSCTSEEEECFNPGTGVFSKKYEQGVFNGKEPLQETFDMNGDSTGYVHAGHSIWDLYLVKLDTEGNIVFERQYEGDYSGMTHVALASSVKQTFDGNQPTGYILVGWTQQHDFPNNVEERLWLVKTDINGDFCDFSRDGDCIGTGENGVTVFARNYGGYEDSSGVSAFQTSEGGYAFIGDYRYGIWLGKTNQEGNIHEEVCGPSWCNCGDTLSFNHTLPYDLNCPNDGLEIGADGITLDCGGYYIYGSGNGNGIDLNGHTGVTIKNCIISNFEHGIDLDSNDNTVLLNVFFNNDYGVFVTGSFNTLTENSFSGGDTENAYETSSNNIWGIGDTGNYWNDFESNEGHPNEYVVPGPGNGIDHAPLETMPLPCPLTIIEDTTLTQDVLDCADTGIIINADDATLDCQGHLIDGKFYSAVYGVFSNKDRVTVKNCHIQDFDYGIHLNDSRYSELLNNLIDNRFQHGIYLKKSSDNTITNNTINYTSTLSDGYYGIELSSQSRRNTITDNIIGNCRYDGMLIQTRHNNIAGNTLLNNDRYGIYIVLSSDAGNTIWDNTFLNNGENAYEPSTENETSNENNWNLSDVGNYWDDFEGNPGYPNYYEIPGNGDGIDWHPL